MNFKTRVQKTKQFVQEHQTAVACGATAIITWKLTKDSTLKAVIAETTPLVYGWGLRAGQLEMLLDDIEKYVDQSYNFIKERGLESEFIEFANMRSAA